MSCGCGKCNCRVTSSDESVTITAVVGGYDLTVAGAGVGAITSVFGRTGPIVAVAGDYTATKITNTPAGTISSTNVQTALNELDTEKEPRITGTSSSDYYRGDKTFVALNKAAVGLGSVDNTSDVSKPISSLTQAALDAKQGLDSDLTAIAGITHADNDIIQAKSGAWTNRTMAQLKTDLSLTKSDVGLSAVTNDAQVKLSTVTTKGDIYVATASGTVARLAAGADGLVLTTDSTQTTGLKYAAAGGGGGSVSTVFGRTGTVVAVSGDYTATQVTNTPAGNIASTTVQAALNELDTEKEPAITIGTSTQYYRGDKTMQTLNKAAVGLSSVDNTADTAKPVSTLQQTAIDAKVANTITSGVTTIAPAQDAVYTALAGKQASDAELTAIAGLTSAADQVPYFTGSGTASLMTVTSAARSVLDDISSSAMRTTLGVAIGSNVQAWDADLDSIAALTATANDIIQYKSGAWANRTVAQYKTDLSLTASDVGLGSVTNDAQVKLSTVTTKGDIYVATGAGAVSRLAAGTDGYLLTADSTQTTGLKYSAPTSGGDTSSNTSSSVDSEIALFSGTGGKTIKRATGSGIAKITSGVLSTAAAGTDYAPATSGSSILKGNGSGGFSNATSATDYAPATTGSSALKASSGGFATATINDLGAQTADYSANTHKITNVTDPTSAQDAASKNYVDTIKQLGPWKDPVRVATTANGTLASAYANGSTVDGITLATGDRILIKNQTTASENGIYTVNASGAPTRAIDADASGEIIVGTNVTIQAGSTQAFGRQVCTATGATPWVPGSSTSTWSSAVAGTVTTASVVTANGFAGTVATATTTPAITLTTSVTGVLKGNGTAISAATADTDYTTPTGTGTITNKRITKRIGTTASSGTPTINTDNFDGYSITALTAAITSFTTNLTGTPVIGDTFIIDITDNGTAHAISWGTSFEASTVALPTTTVISTRLTVAFRWNPATTKWTCVGVA